MDLREPYAGELVVPRKIRIGHRVHINPFAGDPSAPQVRISSNFVTYGECLATDEAVGLDQLSAARVIAAFLISSFGQIQFELKGVNREGLLALEKGHLDGLLVVDPRALAPDVRDEIVGHLERLPYPVPTDILSAQQPRVSIDRIFANVLAVRAGLDADALLEEVHNAIDEWIVAREP